jgi:hypothetical protein
MNASTLIAAITRATHFATRTQPVEPIPRAPAAEGSPLPHGT